MSETTHGFYPSERKTRNGNMAFVIKLANLFKAQQESPGFKEIENLNSVFNKAWNDFVKNELNSSNELNNRALGGRQRTNTDPDDDDPSSRLDENMEEIMSRFNIVNSLMSKSNNDDDDDDDKQDDEPETEDSQNFDKMIEEEFSTSVTDTKALQPYEYKRIEVTLPEERPLERQMTDPCYWRVNHMEDSLDDLLADYE